MPEYLEVSEARQRSGLRLVLTAGVPGPWGEAAKGLFFAKAIDYAAVRQEGGGENAALEAWTGYANAPQALYEDEAARCGWREIIDLAERLAPEPALLPEDPSDREAVLEWVALLADKNGLGWNRRSMLLQSALSLPPEILGKARRPLERLASRYGYSPEAASKAPARVAEILQRFAAQWQAQRARGRHYLVGQALSAADIYWAAFAALLRPLPQDLCRMPETLRGQYGAIGPVVEAALDDALLLHRDAIYRDHLALPLDL